MLPCSMTFSKVDAEDYLDASENLSFQRFVFDLGSVRPSTRLFRYGGGEGEETEGE